MKKRILFVALLISLFAQAQVDSLSYKKSIIKVTDTITFYNVSTDPYFFQLNLKNNKPIDSTTYKIDFSYSKIFLKDTFYKKYSNIDSLKVHFYTYPEFLTKTYFGLDTLLIVPNNPNAQPIALEPLKKQSTVKPFEGLDTQGNITRGVTVGNNQDALLNSILDLKIEGKLSPKITLRARINDTNIPIQENGYSQDLKDLDRVYIEMEGPKWAVKAGDVFLQNKATYFMNFNKKVSGVSVQANLGSTHIFASGALVRGRFITQNFQGQEANQGPYKLSGPTGEAYIFIISGSEKVFINGIPQNRGKNKDYVIDYNTAEITFTPTTPITSDMRISIEFQYSDRNYTRFVTHNGGQYIGEKLQIGAYYFRESEAKNDPLQLSLSDEQIALLAQAGNNSEQLLVTNAIETAYSENKILYRLLSIGGDDVYEYSSNPSETLYQVSFSYVGNQLGDYKILEFLAIGKKMEYVGENNGDYKAITPLIAPSKQQIIAINSHYQPNKKMDIGVELAYSDNDPNLFSSIDDANNKAPAIKASWNQILLDSTKKGWQLNSQLNFDFVHHNFKSLERIFNVEFNRDWNVINPLGNQSLLQTQLQFSNKEKGQFSYQFDNLTFAENYKGNKHTFNANFYLKKFHILHKSSTLKSTGSFINTTFTRSHTNIKYQQQKWWAGTLFDFENNQYNDEQTANLTLNSFQYADLQTLVGVGDSAKVFVEIGTHFRTNDSLVNTNLERVNNSTTWFVNSQLIKAKNAQLKLYTNYRQVDYINKSNTDALNSRLTYKQQLFNQFVTLQTDYKNTSGNIPRQDYTYIETDTGQGFYTWIDYNENGLQELDEFEVAQYADQANFLRIALPNINYIPTQEAALQQTIQINFSKWASQKGIKKMVSHWYNQLHILAQNNKKRTNNLLNINPFDLDGSNVLGMQYNLRNMLVFNRGKAHYTTSYLYTNSRQKIVQSFGSQNNDLEMHQILFQHKIKDNWQIGLTVEQAQNSTNNDSFINRNYIIDKQALTPNISYFFNKNHWIKAAYSVTSKNNQIGDLETLDQQQIGLNYQFSNKKQTTFSAEIKALKNEFTGNNYSAVGYQMLEGLQPGNNMTWNMLWSYKLNSYLFLNLNYNGRSNTFSRTIHNGNVQLRAQF
jgi:hypothetical protein